MDLVASFTRFIQDHASPWVVGSTVVPSCEQTLYVKDQEYVSFPFPHDEQLRALYNNAAPTSFGRTIVIDNFAINLRPTVSMLQTIQTQMAPGDDDTTFVRAELYHVNIYGPGDNFREHKDTPQTSAGHFGSLVYCLPTACTGGEFVLRDIYGKETKFDWASKYASMKAFDISSASTAAIGAIPIEYIAFASEIMTHWVEPVQSGYRVTVTFHLFLEDQGIQLISPSTLLLDQLGSNPIAEQAMTEILSPANDDKTMIFLLMYDYSERDGSKVVLKAGDAILFDMLKRMSANPQVMFHYGNCVRSRQYLTDKEYIYTGEGLDDECSCDTFDALAKRYKTQWIRKRMSCDRVLSVGGHYGVELYSSPFHGNVCIVVMARTCTPVSEK